MDSTFSILNNTDGNHKDFLITLFKQSEEVVIAVGFLKESGWQNMQESLKDFCKVKENKSTFYIGIGYGETDPKSLQSLYNTIKRKANHQLFICSPDAGIFHPKIYFFINGKNVTIITGSSNVTHGGWVINDEVSMVMRTTIDSTEYKKLQKYFNVLNKEYDTDDVDGLIKKYKAAKEAYDAEYGKRPAFRFRRKRSTIAGIDMPRLKFYYQKYINDDKWFKVREEREAEYKEAKHILERLADTKELSNEEFHKLFGRLVGHEGFGYKLWHSGSIHRKSYGVLDHTDTFRELVRIAKFNIDEPVSIAYDKMINFRKIMFKEKKISGIGENIIAEILLSFKPDKFANLNKNPITVLKDVGVAFPRATSFKGADYEKYLELLTKIRSELKMKTFLEIDSFFNYVYWNLLEDNNAF